MSTEREGTKKREPADLIEQLNLGIDQAIRRKVEALADAIDAYSANTVRARRNPPRPARMTPSSAVGRLRTSTAHSRS